MSGSKAALKAVKAALDSQKYEDAVEQARRLLEVEPKNYHANVFLGLALEKLNRRDESEKAYKDAAEIKDKDALVWQGLINLYDKQEEKKLDAYEDAVIRLARIYGEANDRHRCQDVVDRFVLFAKKWGSKAQYRKALHLQSPDSPLYGYLEGRSPHPSYIYGIIVDISEAEEKQFINKEIGERRTRLGAKGDQVTVEVKNEAFARFNLEGLYQKVIDWSNDDEVRRNFEEKLLQRAYDTLLILPSIKKARKRVQVQKLAQDMVIIKHPFILAWQIQLEWKDAESLSDCDVGVIREYIDLFPEDGLSKVLKGYLESEICPFPKLEVETTDNSESNSTIHINPEDRLILVTEGLDDSKSSLLSHRIMADYYLFLEEYSSAVDTARNAQILVSRLIRDTGLSLQNTKDAVNITLGNSLTSYQSPRYHPEAKSIFEEILSRKPTSTSALLGIGLIFEEDEDYNVAAEWLAKALERDTANLKVRCELAWCEALSGEYSKGLQDLSDTSDALQKSDPHNREMKAQLLYRIGYCQWHLDESKAARKSRNRAYAKFLAAIQANINLAPAYTMLGVFYSDYAKDRNRARKCFQKALELSSSETEAARRLAMNFADQSEWDLVEAVAQRVVDSGKARPAPGSKKKAVSWPFASLGTVQLNKQQYVKAIVSFQTALRMSPDDYHSWVGLGESYHHSGRYIAATRAFNHAEIVEAKLGLDPAETWFARYMLANVKRELGQYGDAIAGYNTVLASKPKELGVQIALLQTITESAWRNIELGLFGQAISSATSAFDVASEVVEERSGVFNLWKCIGDACSIFTWVQSRESDLPASRIQSLLLKEMNTGDYNILGDFDNVGESILRNLITNMKESERPIFAAILAQKRGVLASNHDVHAQATAWYNLGWTEFRAHTHLGAKGTMKSNRFLKAAVQCFKRAIELEAGNSEFWNALGVVTSTLNAKVAQHSLVRSLHLNERSAHLWTNLGVLYTIHNELQLANDAFTRSQSADPDYAPAWLGQGLLALLFGDVREARLLFTHAFEISNSASIIAKRQYILSSFDFLISESTPSNELTQLIQPLFALHQLSSQVPDDESFQHLLALFDERIGDADEAESALTCVLGRVESEYEETESLQSLSRYAQVQADRARVQLGHCDFSGAIESSRMALDLSEEGNFDLESRRKWRLSAHITAGLAYNFEKSMDQAIDMFRFALEESDNDPDIVCLLAQVLWAKGGEEERSVAREQLFDCVEKHSEHVGAMTTLGVIALLDSDDDVIDAVDADLHSMRMRDDIALHDKSRITKVLSALAAYKIEQHTGSQETEMIYEADRSVMLAPFEPQGWSELAKVSSVEYVGEMALKMALKAVSPEGDLGAAELAAAYRQVRKAGDAQRAILLAPWEEDAWVGFAEIYNEVTRIE